MPTSGSHLVALLGVSVAVVMACAASVHGQSAGRVYVSGGVLTEVKRFSGDLTDNVLDGETIGGSLGLGSSIGDRWELLISADLPRSTKVVEERSLILRSSRVTLQSTTRNRVTSISTLVRFHPTTESRVRLGYLAGLAFSRMQEQFATAAPDDVPSSLIPRPLESIEYATSPIVGIDAQLPLAAHLSAVPAFYAFVFRSRGVSGLVMRPGVCIRWTF